MCWLLIEIFKPHNNWLWQMNILKTCVLSFQWHHNKKLKKKENLNKFKNLQARIKLTTIQVPHLEMLLNHWYYSRTLWPARSNPLLSHFWNISCFCCVLEHRAAVLNGILTKSFFPIITDDKSVGSIRLFLMIDSEISANSQHSLTVFYSFNRWYDAHYTCYCYSSSRSGLKWHRFS